MSNAVRYDPLIAHYLAAELNERMRDRRCAAAPSFARDRSVTLPMEGGEELRLDLHPSRGWIRIVTADRPGSPRIDATCTGVFAPADERMLEIGLEGGDRFQSRRRVLVIELQTNQRNAALVGEDGRIVAVLHSRRTATRSLRVGEVYAPHPTAARFAATAVTRAEAWSVWRSRLGRGPEIPRAELIAAFAYTGALNADWILGSADGSFDLEAAFDRWWWLRSHPEPGPCLLRLRGRVVPYPLTLAGISAEPAPSLLSAIERAADLPGESDAVDPFVDRARHLAERNQRAAERKVEGLRRELASTGASQRLRDHADLLLARLNDIPRGLASVRLEDWNGAPVEIGLDPGITPAENAARLYEQARRRDRAEEQLPALIRSAERDLARWEAALQAIDDGQVPAWVEQLVVRGDTQSPGASPSRTGAGAESRRSYRTFRTSGGLEVRVGRSSKDNDRLTLRDSSPNDVWLHAQSVPGSHVILRWADPQASPPARDLAEAAQLAALHSRARTSSTVAVDWTRRKYVRKPRGAPPGRVVLQRVKTLFVEPDEAVINRLAE